VSGRRKPRPPGLILPVSVLERRIVGECYICGDPVYAGDEAHIGNCAREMLPEIMKAREARRADLAIFDEASWDPEVSEHMRRVGRRMLAEGRLVVKPSERAGF
jgi:hypothetical protein